MGRRQKLDKSEDLPLHLTTVTLIREEIKSRMRKIAFVIFFCLCTVLYAQDTVAFFNVMPAVDISVINRSERNGTRRDITDSTLARLYPAGTLSDLLGSTVAQKSVGPGALSTIAIRGANSMQTPVLWNGVNLQNINNNTVDLSLIPTFLFEQISVEPGTSSALGGSGAIGGAIRVNSMLLPRIGNEYLAGNYFRLKTVNEFGSYSNFMQGVQFGYGINRWKFDLKMYKQNADNDYIFRNIAITGHPIDTLEHAQVFQQGLMSSAAWTSKNSAHSVSFRSWVQETSREIPPTMVQTSNESVQRDYALRNLIQWAYYSRNWTINVSSAFIHEGLLWDPGYMSPISNTDAWTSINEVRATYDFGLTNKWLTHRAQINFGATGNWSSSEVTEFIVRHQQVRVGAYVQYSKVLRKSDELNISLREEVIDGNVIDPVGSIWYSLSLSDKFLIKACVSHNYRVPTFNDLYWAPGGNPNLKAETGWTEELTAQATVLTKKRFQIKYAITGYNRNVINMITWVPHASYWSPVNVAEVWSRGVEHRLRIEQRVGKSTRFIAVMNVDYVRSTYEKTDDPNDVALGKQLIYVPAWFAGITLTAQWRGMYMSLNQFYNDLGFTTRDHLGYLPGYTIGNAAIGWELTRQQPGKRHYALNVFFRCNNILNVQYQSVAWRPMPGRTFTFGLSFDFAQEFFKPQDK